MMAAGVTMLSGLIWSLRVSRSWRNRAINVCPASASRGSSGSRWQLGGSSAMPTSVSTSRSPLASSATNASVAVLLRGGVVGGVERQLDQLGVRLHQATCLQLGELPVVPEPGGDGGIGGDRQVGVVEPPGQVGPALLDDGVQPAELVEGF